MKMPVIEKGFLSEDLQKAASRVTVIDIECDLDSKALTRSRTVGADGLRIENEGRVRVPVITPRGVSFEGDDFALHEGRCGDYASVGERFERICVDPFAISDRSKKGGLGAAVEDDADARLVSDEWLL